jgi:hypothetical protein
LAQVRGKIVGNINGIELEDVKLIGNIHTIPGESKSQVVIVNKQPDETEQLLINIATPIFWLFTVEDDPELNRNLLNGFALTGN